MQWAHRHCPTTVVLLYNAVAHCAKPEIKESPWGQSPVNQHQLAAFTQPEHLLSPTLLFSFLWPISRISDWEREEGICLAMVQRNQGQSLDVVLFCIKGPSDIGRRHLWHSIILLTSVLWLFKLVVLHNIQSFPWKTKVSSLNRTKTWDMCESKFENKFWRFQVQASWPWELALRSNCRLMLRYQTRGLAKRFWFSYLIIAFGHSCWMPAIRCGLKTQHQSIALLHCSRNTWV